MAWTDTYELVVYSIEATFTDRKDGAYHIKQAMYAIVDMQASDELADEASTNLLFEIKKFYNWILHHINIEDKREILIYRINEFTERYKGDLTAFVNSVSWVDGCVPYNWAETSESSRFDTSDWIVCS